jgi:hypothetical protein
MHESAVILMRSHPEWLELPTSDANHVFQCKDAVMTIFPDGSWQCEIPQRLSKSISTGKVHHLDEFLNQFVTDNLL